jgi:SPFH domain/Band 7 family protein
VEEAKKVVSRMGPVLAVGSVLLLIGLIVLSRVGCVNVHTPPGFEGYIRSNPIAGAGKYIGTQTGPTSTGWVWRQKVINIDMRPRTYTENMEIPTSNRLKLSLNAHARIKLRKGGVKQIVEELGGENWYATNVRDRFRGEVRDQVQRLDQFEVKNEINEIGARVLTQMQERYKDTPIEFVSINIGDMQYPDAVVDSVTRKFVTMEENERKDIELRIAQKQIEIGKAQANGTRDAQQIIRTTLDDMYLQFEAIKAIESLTNSPNTTVVITPYSPGGQAPIIMNVGGGQ